MGYPSPIHKPLKDARRVFLCLNVNFLSVGSALTYLHYMISFLFGIGVYWIRTVKHTVITINSNSYTIV